MRSFKWCHGLVLGIAMLVGVCQCDNWYVVVSTSRYWFNYRHLANSLSVYAVLRQLGVPDSRIILMNSDSVACDPRNAILGSIYNNHNTRYDLCGSGVETDYEGDQVTVDAFLNVLTGRHAEGVPRHQRLQSTNTSRVILYMGGHGGDEFLKFHDHEELTATALGAAVEEMGLKGRFGELLVVVDTCQAATLGNYIESPDPTKGVTFVGSSHKGENSYGYNLDEELGVALIDRFTYGIFDYFGRHFALFAPPTPDTTRRVDAEASFDPFAAVAEEPPPPILLGTKSRSRPAATPRAGRPTARSLLPKLRVHSLHDLFGSMDFRYLYSNIFTKQSGNTRDLRSMSLADYFN